IYSPLSCSAHAPAPRQLSTLALHDALPISSTGMLMATTSSHFVERKKPETSNHRTRTNPSAHPLLLPSRPSLSSCSRSCSLHLCPIPHPHHWYLAQTQRTAFNWHFGFTTRLNFLALNYHLPHVRSFRPTSSHAD